MPESESTPEPVVEENSSESEIVPEPIPTPVNEESSSETDFIVDTLLENE